MRIFSILVARNATVDQYALKNTSTLNWEYGSNRRLVFISVESVLSTLFKNKLQREKFIYNRFKFAQSADGDIGCSADDFKDHAGIIVLSYGTISRERWISRVYINVSSVLTHTETV